MRPDLPPTLAAAYALEAELRARHPNYGRPDGFDGYGHGPDQFVCTTYCIAVLRRAGYPVDRTLSDRINIEDFESPLAEAVARGDDAISGIAWGLEMAGLGERVADPMTLRAGDFMQYWYRTADGRLLGHVAQIAERVEGGVRIHGAHRSTRGMAIHPEVIRLDNKVALFGVRPHAHAPHLLDPSGYYVIGALSERIEEVVHALSMRMPKRRVFHAGLHTAFGDDISERAQLNLDRARQFLVLLEAGQTWEWHEREELHRALGVVERSSGRLVVAQMGGPIDEAELPFGLVSRARVVVEGEAPDEIAARLTSVIG